MEILEYAENDLQIAHRQINCYVMALANEFHTLSIFQIALRHIYFILRQPIARYPL